MNISALETFARGAASSIVDPSAFAGFCASLRLSEMEAYDDLAVHIANGFISKEWSFEDADEAVNNLWTNLVCSARAEDWEIPKIFFSIYEAFDAGEFKRADEAEDVDPVEKYTLPLLREALESAPGPAKAEMPKPTWDLILACQSMLNGELSYFEGAIKVCSLAASTGLDPNDSDLQNFVHIQSETDHLPPARCRHLWSEEALVKVDQELASCEEWAAALAPEACRRLISKLLGDAA